MPGDPHQALAAAMIRQAARDTRRGDPEAAGWLLDCGYGWAVDFLGLGLSWGAWESWVNAGCPKRRRNRKD